MLLELSTREVEVAHVEAIGAHFRVLTLRGESLRGAAWSPGEMVQIILSGSALLGPWELRAYTPLAFEPEQGRMQILAFIHGRGPGADWVASTAPGARVRLVGPRHALALLSTHRPLVFFGDETSFSTAIALRATPLGHRDVRFIFEVNSIEASRAVLERFGMPEDTKLIAREETDGHLAKVEREVLHACDSAAVLTGKASSIQRLHKALRAAGVSSRRITSVAYWATGKRGL